MKTVEGLKKVLELVDSYNRLVELNNKDGIERVTDDMVRIWMAIEDLGVIPCLDLNELSLNDALQKITRIEWED